MEDIVGSLESEEVTSPSTQRLSTATSDLFQLIRSLSWLVFGLQFVGMAAWSTLLYERFCGTMDESSFFQALFLIDHGSIDPYSTALRIPFIQDHGAILTWLAAPLEMIEPRGLFVLLLQDFAVVTAGIIAFHWISKILEQSSLGSRRAWRAATLATLGLLLLVANPFTYTAISFDVHQETFALPFIIAAAFDFSSRRFRRAWIWILFTLLLGDVSASWVLGLGVSAIVAGILDRPNRSKFWKHGLLLGVAGMGWVGALTTFGLEKNSSKFFNYLVVAPGTLVPNEVGPTQLAKAILGHPQRLASALASQFHNILANLAPTGVLGVLTPWTLGVPLVILIENDLTQGNLFSAPSFQSIPIYYFGAVGLVILLAAVFSKWPSRPVFIVAVVFFTVNSLLWASIFIPHIEKTWLTVSSSQASVLTQAELKIPQSAEVVVSQGVSGRFANRRYIYMAAENLRTPLHGKTIWFVIATTAGIEFSEINQSQIATQLAGPMHARLIASTNGIYVFKWTRPEGVDSILFHSHRFIDAWTAVGPSGTAVFNAGPTHGYVTTRKSVGIFVSGDYWNEMPGSFIASVNIVSRVPYSVIVFNASSGQILGYKESGPSAKLRSFEVPFKLVGLVPRSGSFSGHGIVSIDPVPPPPGNEIEVLVANSRFGAIRVYQLGVYRL